ncbi:50S ribosomal protein L18 [Candidatus Wolfebacteria bacterium]|nr:50S ribosomal protein L18 [Candidatus Wolfebacteria bacterium]
MKKRKDLNQIRSSRGKRVRAKIFGTASLPRFSVFRSHSNIYAQLIDDENGFTLVSAFTGELKDKQAKKIKAVAVGELIAKRALEKGVKEAVFDRGNYKYHGRIKEVAESARKGGLRF